MTGTDEPGEPHARLLDVPRSVAFYAMFYGGTLIYVAAAFVALVIGRRAFCAVVVAWSRYHRHCMRWLLGIRVEVSGKAPPPGALLAIKHESFFEALDLPVMFGHPAVIAKAELLRIPLWGRIARSYGLIPVERDDGAKALRAMIAAARTQSAAGRLLVIFPEGTRVPHGTAPPLQSGFAAMYKLPGVKVVPVAVDSGLLYQRLWKRGGVIHVHIGEPIAPGLPRTEIEERVHAAINLLNDLPQDALTQTG